MQTEDELTGANEKKRHKRINHLTVIAMSLISGWVAVVAQPSEWTLAKLIGLVVWVGGMVLWTVARWQLGSSFTGKAVARDLVTSGIYSRIQNPIYIAGPIILIGISLYLDKPWALLVLPFLIPTQIARIRRERSALTEGFGQRYIHYRRQTWF